MVCRHDYLTPFPLSTASPPLGLKKKLLQSVHFFNQLCESLLIVIWFLWLVCLQQTRGKKKLFCRGARQQPLGSTQSVREMKCHVLSLHSVHMHAHKLFPQWNRTMLQFDPANLSAYFCFHLQDVGRESLHPASWQSGFIHYVHSTL